MYLPKAVAFQPPDQVGIVEIITQWLARVWEGLLAVSEDVKVWLVHAAQTIDGPLREHPYISLYISLLIFLGPWILLLPLLLLQATFFIVLYILGFCLSAIIGGSPTALYEAFCYGEHTPSASLFALMQASGTHYNAGTMNNGFLLFIRMLAWIVGMYVLFEILLA